MSFRFRITFGQVFHVRGVKLDDGHAAGSEAKRAW
jgi:hypothetical protein